MKKSKKVIVSREWYEEAMKLKQDSDKILVEGKTFFNALENFLYTILPPDQQKILEKEIEKFIEEYKGETNDIRI